VSVKYFSIFSATAYDMPLTSCLIMNHWCKHALVGTACHLAKSCYEISITWWTSGEILIWKL